MGFDASALRYYICQLLATESARAEEVGLEESRARGAAAGGVRGVLNATMQARGEDMEMGLEAPASRVSAIQFRANFYADLTLDAWLDVVDGGAHGPDGRSLSVALQQLVTFTTFGGRGEDSGDGESARVIVDRIASRPATLSNIVDLLRSKNEDHARMSCTLIRHMLQCKPVIRVVLVSKQVLPYLFSTIVPAEQIKLMLRWIRKRLKERQEQLMMARKRESGGAGSSGSSYAEKSDEARAKAAYRVKGGVKLSDTKKIRLAERQHKAFQQYGFDAAKAKMERDMFTVGRKHLRRRVNTRPFRSLALIIEAVSLLEILSTDPDIKRRIHNVKAFPGQPIPPPLAWGKKKKIRRFFVYSDLDGYDGRIRPAFYALQLLLQEGMSAMLMPDTQSTVAQDAAVVPLHVAVMNTLTALCRFDGRNKVAVARITMHDLVRILITTRSNALQHATLTCIHSIVSDFVNLPSDVRRLLRKDDDDDDDNDAGPNAEQRPKLKERGDITRTLEETLERLSEDKILEGGVLAKRTKQLIYGVTVVRKKRR